MIKMLKSALGLFLVLTLITGVVYPLVVTGIARVAMPAQAGGTLLMRDGKAVGSALLGQSFTDPGHFWGRPSATGPQPYNGAASTGSNLSPTNPALLEAISARVQALTDQLAHDGWPLLKQDAEICLHDSREPPQPPQPDWLAPFLLPSAAPGGAGGPG